MLKLIFISIIIIIIKKNKIIFISLIIIILNLEIKTFSTNRISYIFIIDHFSFWLTNLTTWIFFIIFTLKNKKKKYFFFINILIINLLIIFNIWNIILFFFIFESRIIIIILIIINWSYQFERLEAIFFILFFTLLFSLPFILTIIYTQKFNNFILIIINNNLIVYLRFLTFFLVKIPLFFIHFWLPKAHVESPVFGSIILAAILLKLGFYGIIRRYKIFILFNKLNFIFLSINLWSIIFLRIICITITDIKIIIAYSSIIHINLTILNLIIIKYKRIFGRLIIIIGHGLSSSCLFFLTNFIYSLSKSRRILINKGTAAILPQLNFWWFINCINNVPVPPSINILGEIFCLKIIINFLNKIFILISLIMFFRSIFRIYLYFITTHGKFSKNIINSNFLNLKQSTISFFHLTPLILLSCKINLFTIYLNSLYKILTCEVKEK